MNYQKVQVTHQKVYFYDFELFIYIQKLKILGVGRETSVATASALEELKCKKINIKTVAFISKMSFQGFLQLIHVTNFSLKFPLLSIS